MLVFLIIKKQKNKVKLSDREKEVLYLITHEKSTKEIAET